MKTRCVVICACALLVCGSAQAVTVSVLPPSQTVSVGDPVSVDVDVSGLGNFAPPSLDVFDVDVSYDSSILSPTTVVFGSELDVFGVGSIQRAGGFAPVSVFEASLDLATDLDTLQPGQFTLFTITFDAIGPGISPIDASVVLLSDALGNFLIARTRGATVTVEPVTVIPEPLTVAGVLLGIASVARYVRRRTGA